MTESKSKEVRLDKWLWAARFFKTRSMATDAIKGGRVHVFGQRIKSAKTAQIGQIIQINKPPQSFEIEVLALSDKRGSFTIAQQLYRETPESIVKRKQEAEQRKFIASAYERNAFKGRPTKRNRRQIVQFTQSEHYDE